MKAMFKEWHKLSLYRRPLDRLTDSRLAALKVWRSRLKEDSLEDGRLAVYRKRLELGSLRDEVKRVAGLEQEE